ncbi:MAG: hypothetical protein M3R25_08075, partial [Bacteroidota bacterium]|nr:hypothetical protein [Bacteroidota bacterium]
MIRRLVICVLLFGSIEQNLVFSQELITQSYNAQNGLSSSSVYSFYHDRLGYFWIGTLQGLDRYDGTTFKKYGIKDGLPSVMCNTFFEDTHNRFWVGTRMGIAEFKKDSFFVYPTTDHKQLGYVFQLFEDRQGHLIANTSEGQYKFISGKWMPENNSKLGTAEIITFNKGDYYTSNLGLFHQQEGGTVQCLFPVQNQNGPFIWAMNLNKDVPYLTTRSGFYKFEVEAQSGMLRPVKEFTAELNGKHLRSTKLDTKGRWWFSTEEDGVLMLENKQGHIIQNKIPFSFNYVALFYEDRNGQMWITSPYGVLKVSQTPYSSMAIREMTKDNHIMHFIPLKKNQLMLSINDGRLLHIEYTLDAIPSYKVMDTYQLDSRKDFIDHY